MEEDDLPYTAPSNREKSRTLSEKAYCHYPDQISPKPALTPLKKIKVTMINMFTQMKIAKKV